MPERTALSSTESQLCGCNLAPRGNVDPNYEGPEPGDDCTCDDCDCPVCCPGCC